MELIKMNLEIPYEKAGAEKAASNKASKECLKRQEMELCMILNDINYCY